MSDPSTFLDADLDRAEKSLLLQDRDLEVLGSMELEPRVSSPEELPFLKVERLNVNSLKVEGPLTPMNSLPPSSDMAIDLADIAKGVDMDQVLDKPQLDSFGIRGQEDPM